MLRVALLSLVLAPLVLGCATAGDGANDDGGGGRTADARPPKPDGAADAAPDAVPPDAGPPDAYVCVETGAACDSGNPGACASGTMRCVSNTPTCVPDVTEEPCYDGPVGSNGVAACHGGTRTCIGALGTCNGEVLPAAKEDCFNDLDDDCDTFVNDSCPLALELGAERLLSPHGGWGGWPNGIRCPANQFVAESAFLSTSSTPTYVSGIQIFCVQASLVRDTASRTYTLTETPLPGSFTAAISGANVAASPWFNVTCPTGRVSAMWGIAGYAATYVDGIGGYCANVDATFNADNSLSLPFTPISGLQSWYTQTTPYNEHCAYGDVIIGYDMRLGDWMDQVTAVCAPLVVRYR